MPKNTTKWEDNKSSYLKPNNIVIIIFLIGLIAMFIGLFGTWSTTYYFSRSSQGVFNSQTNNGGITEWFYYGWVSFAKSLKAGSNSAAGIFINTFLGLSSFLLAVGFTSFYITNFIICVIKKENVNLNKTLSVVGIFALQYAFLSNILYGFNSTNQSFDYDACNSYSTLCGWGSIVVFAGFVISYIILLIYEHKHNNSNMRLFINTIIIAFVLFTGIFGFSKTIKEIDKGSSYQSTCLYNAFRICKGIFINNDSSIKTTVSTYLSAGFGLILFLLSFVSILYVIYNIITNDGSVKSKIKLTIVSCITLVSYFGCSLLAKNAIAKYSERYTENHFTYSFNIIFFIDCSLLVITVIASIISSLMLIKTSKQNSK